MNDKFISVGKILNFHGIKGEAKIGYTKGNEAFIASLKSVNVNDGEKFITLHIESVRFHKQFALIKFKEINTNSPKLNKYVEGIKIAKPALIMGALYYIAAPVVSTILADIVTSKKGETNKCA